MDNIRDTSSAKHRTRKGRNEFTVDQITFVERFSKSTNAVQRQTFRDVFSPTGLKALEKSVDRGTTLGIGKGLGDFGKVLDAAKAMAKSDDPRTEAAELSKLIKVAGEYLAPRQAEFAAEQLKGAKADARTLKKYEACTAMLREAKQRQLDLFDTRHPPPSRPADRAPYMEKRAIDMAATFGASRASGGTSTVNLVKDPMGRVAYAFKPMSGESAQTFLPTGGAAVREAMCSFVADAIKEQTRGLLDFGAPRAVIATMPDTGMGALVQGIHGAMADPEGISADYAKDRIDEATYKKRMQASLALSQGIAAKELQKVLLCNLATANFDIKWGNMICVDDGQGGTSARPFDGGAAFPTDEFIEHKELLEQEDGVPIGKALIYEAVSGIKGPALLPQATQPMDKDLVAQFLKINVAALEGAARVERDSLLQAHKLDPSLLDDKAMLRAFQSMRAVQKILSDDPTQSLQQFLVAYTKVIKTVLG